MSWVPKVGDLVLVASFKKAGIVSAVLKEGDFRVTVGEATVRCRLKDLRPAASPKKEASEDMVLRRDVSISSEMGRINSAAPARLDLHGFKVEEALRALEDFISRSIMANLSEVIILHGFGSGKVKDATHKKLAELKVVKRFELNPYNRGETRVFL